LVEVEDGKLQTVSGDKANPDSQGFLCVRGRSTNEIVGNPGRLLYPQIRDDRRANTWRRVSWDEALDFIVKRMRAVGPEAVGLWAGRGTPGSAITVQMMNRFSNIYGCQNWHPAMICWGLGGFGLGLTGPLKVNTKEDMAENSRMIVLWGANIPTQPNTARHIISARRRGAKVVTIDVRRTEAAAQSDEILLIRPGSDAALALAVIHVIITERLYDQAFVETHTAGFEELSTYILPFTPAWGAEETGLEASQITSYRPGLRLDASSHDPAGRQFHGQGCQRLARRTCDQPSSTGKLPSEPNARHHRSSIQRSAEGLAASGHQHAVVVQPMPDTSQTASTRWKWSSASICS
jgi:anaerobic selenocysteine-containing dehydrogenase